MFFFYLTRRIQCEHAGVRSEKKHGPSARATGRGWWSDRTHKSLALSLHRKRFTRTVGVGITEQHFWNSTVYAQLNKKQMVKIEAVEANIPRLLVHNMGQAPKTLLPTFPMMQITLSGLYLKFSKISFRAIKNCFHRVIEYYSSWRINWVSL